MFGIFVHCFGRLSRSFGCFLWNSDDQRNQKRSEEEVEIDDGGAQENETKKFAH